MKKNIAILGTRGIPNHYGGFEQLAEYLAVALVQRGHHVVVFNSSLHPLKSDSWKGVTIRRGYDPENIIGSAGQFIYDLHGILQLRRMPVDAVLQLGYTSSSIWHRLLPEKAKIVTNMDGLEWKRSKYSSLAKRFLKYAEKLAVRSSDILIADSIGIQDYLEEKYRLKATWIPYGAEVFSNPDVDVIRRFHLEPRGYYMILARMEPENNIEMVIQGFIMSESEKKLLVVGNLATSYGKFLRKKYGKDRRVIFQNAIYDITILNNLRFFSDRYFHGHSTGGTNPSLLEAMAAGALIHAHDNVFNRGVLGDQGIYFSDAIGVKKLLLSEIDGKIRDLVIAANMERIRTLYTWENIYDSYEKILTE